MSSAGERYRFERLALPIVLRDLRFTRANPGPGDWLRAGVFRFLQPGIRWEV